MLNLKIAHQPHEVMSRAEAEVPPQWHCGDAIPYRYSLLPSTRQTEIQRNFSPEYYISNRYADRLFEIYF